MALLVVWFAATLLAAPRLRNASLLLLTLATGMLGCEILLRTDAMNRFVEERDLADFRHGLVETLEPLFVPDPVLAFRPLPDRQARATSVKNGRTIYDVTYTTDANGFRKLPPAPVSADAMPVLILGDSFAFGAGLADDQTLASAFVESLLVGSRLFAVGWKAFGLDEAKERRLFVRILREIEAKLAADYGARLVVLYYSGETWHGDLSGWREMMVPLLCASKAPVLDVNALLPRPPQPVDRFYMKDDGHPTALLNRMIASALVEDFSRRAIGSGGLQCAG